MTLQEVAQDPLWSAGFCAILKESKKHRMSDFPTLRSKDGTMVVSFYPVKVPYGDISNTWTLKVLEWKGIDTISKKCLNMRDKSLEIAERIAMGYSVIQDNSNLPQLANPMNGAV